MHKLILFIKEFRIYSKEELLSAIASFSRKQLIIFLISVIISLGSAVIILEKINSSFMVEVPVNGGSINEGIIGVPMLVNPIIALSDADKDLTALIYSGLMRKSSNGELIPDIAESYTVSQDGTTYTFILKEKAKFHNGEKITADDIIFTIDKIKDPLVKSPRRMEWEGVNVTKTDDRTVVFTLSQPYISFMDNTTIGILPSSLWKNVNINDFHLSQLNIKPIGSGPYKIESVIKDKNGISKEYKLIRYKDFVLGKPRIKHINILSFSNEKDLVKSLSNKSIDQAGGISSENIKNININKYNIHTSTLPRIFGIFFNENKNKIFADKTVVNSINKALNRQEIIEQVLGGYGSIAQSPIPEKILKSEYEEEKYTSQMIENINSTLDKAGWIKGDDGIRAKGGVTTKTITKKVKGKTVTTTEKSTTPLTRLSFSLTTGDTPELKKTASLIKDQLYLIGIEVNIDKVYETGQLNQLIRAREYEALFFGQFINHESDLYSFWHSSQKNDPGLNIAMYSDAKADNLLSSIQKTLKPEDRKEKYSGLLDIFNSHTPAFLIYSPKYLYITSPRLSNIELQNITIQSDRFSSVYEWSADTDRVWKIFTK